MSKEIATAGPEQASGAPAIPQYSLPKILFMFAWPAVWFSFLIYIVGRQFIPEGGVTPTRVLLAVIVLGTGAELAVGLVLLRREGYSLTFAALRDRIRWKWPKGWRAWLTALGGFGRGDGVEHDDGWCEPGTDRSPRFYAS